ncbi:uncharacterized protein LOC125458722 isoform X6 [Stegostoma tigrinum]|uniref:uncharacterized protein LOC125458722 isoform X6 n=1 Tax=Stegostoma tigrinum TaxID=3053191 RepID=UPI00202AFC57|nr:uncharacterized protein LOC125458722 isoform X6 [Stegostoma tigrinum]
MNEQGKQQYTSLIRLKDCEDNSAGSEKEVQTPIGEFNVKAAGPGSGDTAANTLTFHLRSHGNRGGRGSPAEPRQPGWNRTCTSVISFAGSRRKHYMVLNQ